MSRCVASEDLSWRWSRERSGAPGSRAGASCLRVAAALLLCGSLVAVARPAAAVTESRKQAEALFLQAVAAFKEDNLQGAAKLFEDALKLDRHPLLLYNLALVYDKLQDKPNAIRSYKEYLKTRPPDDSFIRLRLKQLDPEAVDMLDREMSAAAAVAAAAAGPDAAGEKPAEQPGGGSAGGSGLSRVKGLSWAVLGLGVVAIGAGTAFGVMTIGAESDFESAKLRSEAEDAKDRAESSAMLANIGFGVGAVALTTGVVLAVANMVSGGGEPSGATGSGGEVGTSWTVQPLLTPDGGGLLFGQSF